MIVAVGVMLGTDVLLGVGGIVGVGLAGVVLGLVTLISSISGSFAEAPTPN